MDAEDYERIAAHRWYMKPDGYVVRNVSKPEGGQWTLSLHRAVMGLGYGDSEHVDHRSHDTLDNRKSNLRRCTHAQNHQNRRADRGSSSRYRGVSHRRGMRRPWQAYARVDGKANHLGFFETEQEAADVAAAWRETHMPFTVE